PLDAAFPLAQMDDLAMLIAEHLKLDVSRMLQKPLCIYVWISKGLLRFAARRLIGRKQLALVAHYAHAAPAAAGYGFEDQRVADSRRLLAQLLFPFDDSVASGDGWKARSFHFPPRTVFLSHHFDDFGGRTNEGNLGSFAHLGKVGVLREKTIAGVNSVHVGDFRGA